MIMDGLVLGRGPAGRCDELRVGGGIVDYDAVNGDWRIWYYCRDRQLHEVAPKPLGSGRIGFATSKNGIDWIRFDGPATAGAILDPSSNANDFDSLHIGLTDVTRGAGEWLMWYFGGDRTVRETQSALGATAGLGMRPGLARSKDGIHWEKVRGKTPSGALIDYAPDEAYAGWPNVFNDGRQLVMQYAAPDMRLSQYTTMTAVSDNGVDWRKTGVLEWADGTKPWDTTGMITRQVLPNPLQTGRRFLMIYTGTDENHARSVAAADSDDGVRWHHLYDGPIFQVGAPDAWDCTGVAATRLVPAAGALHFYYYGFQSLGDNDQPRGIGLAISRTGDLRDLVRVKRPQSGL